MKSMQRVGLIFLMVAIALAAVATITNFTTEATTATAAIGSEEPHIEALQSPNATERAAAAEALIGAESDEAMTALLGNLADSDPTAGYYTVMALAASDDPTVAASLVAELQNPDAIVRQRAALALRDMNGTVAVNDLAAALNDGSAALPVAEILVNMDDEAAHDLVLVALADKELTTRRYAVMAAIEGADPVVQNFLLGRALASEDLVLRSNAMELREFIGG